VSQPISALPARIFISYRRQDTDFPAAWLYERLAERFGRGLVFKDIDSIVGGDRFADVIADAVAGCDVLLVLIGIHWTTITDKSGRRRLDSPDDFVRLEIGAALNNNIRVIPVLLQGVTLPRSDELPASMAELVHRQSMEISANRFDSDLGRLVKALETVLAEEEAKRQPVLAVLVRVQTSLGRRRMTVRFEDGAEHIVEVASDPYFEVSVDGNRVGGNVEMLRGSGLVLTTVEFDFTPDIRGRRHAIVKAVQPITREAMVPEGKGDTLNFSLAIDGHKIYSEGDAFE
jgi:hypothetical protein